MTRADRRPPATVVVGAVVALAFLLLPLVGLLQRADWSTLVDDLMSPGARDALRLSLITSISAALLAVVLGTPVAWVLARTELPGRSVLRALVLVPLVMPPVVAGVALVAAFGVDSPAGRWLDDVLGLRFTASTLGAVVAATFVALPFLVLTVEGALRGVDDRYERVAAGLGADRLTVFRWVTLPLIAPSLAAGTALAWARALGEFGATVTFAGSFPGRTQTMPLAINIANEVRPQEAIVLSLVLVAVSFGVLIGLRDRYLAGASGPVGPMP